MELEIGKNDPPQSGAAKAEQEAGKFPCYQTGTFVDPNNAAGVSRSRCDNELACEKRPECPIYAELQRGEKNGKG